MPITKKKRDIMLSIAELFVAIIGGACIIVGKLSKMIFHEKRR